MTDVLRQRLLWTVWAVVFVASLVAVRTLDRVSAPEAARVDAGSLPRAGFRFEEVARASGIDFTHAAPIFDARLDHIMPQIASTGAAVAVADFDRDGWQDLYVTNSAEGSLNR